MDTRRTSSYLRRCLDEPGEKDPPEIVLRRSQESSSAWDWFGRMLLYEHEGLHSVNDGFGPITGPVDERECILDDFLCRQFLRAVPAIVTRLTALERIVTEDEASDSVRMYFQEAVRCQVFGLPTASVALARACLEQALRETIPLAHAQDLGLDSLINEALPTRALDKVHQKWARDVQNMGNRVLHNTACTDQEAQEVIVKVRSIAEMLYGRTASGKD